MNDICKLVNDVIGVDDIGNSTHTKTERQVFCEKQSISQNEFFSAAQSGMKASLKVVIWKQDYNGETIVNVDDVYYAVYRTYMKSVDLMELYLETKEGLYGKN